MRFGRFLNSDDSQNLKYGHCIELLEEGGRSTINHCRKKKNLQRSEEPRKWKGHLGARENTRGNGKRSMEESDNKSRVSDKPLH